MPGEPPATKVSSQPARSDDEWEAIVSAYVAGGTRSADWPREYGIPPQYRASRVPLAIRKKYRFDD
jgi:hypothetical protein